MGEFKVSWYERKGGREEEVPSFVHSSASMASLAHFSAAALGKEGGREGGREGGSGVKGRRF